MRNVWLNAPQEVCLGVLEHLENGENTYKINTWFKWGRWVSTIIYREMEWECVFPRTFDGSLIIRSPVCVAHYWGKSVGVNFPLELESGDSFTIRLYYRDTESLFFDDRLWPSEATVSFWRAVYADEKVSIGYVEHKSEWCYYEIK